MINIGGEKVFPKEIEDIIGSMKEIVEVAVKGIPDKSLGQIVQAFVVPEQKISIKDQNIVDLFYELQERWISITPYS